MKILGLVVFCLISAFSPLCRAETDLPRPDFYPSDERWLLMASQSLENALEEIPDNKLDLDTLAKKLAPIVVRKMLSYAVKKEFVRASIEKRIKAEKAQGTSSVDQLNDLKAHLDLHGKQVAYLAQQLRTRYGFSRLWNSDQSDSVNLLGLARVFNFSIRGNEVLPSKNDSFYLTGPLFEKLRDSLKARLATKFPNVPEASRPWAFKEDTMGKAFKLGLLVKILGSSLAEYEGSQ